VAIEPIYLWDLAGEIGPQPWRTKPTEPDRLWATLLTAKASDAWPAMRELLHRPEAGVKLFQTKIKKAGPVEKLDAAAIARLIRQLDDDDAGERDRASAALGKVARRIEAELRKARETTTSAEARRRLDRLLKTTEGVDPEEVRVIRAVEVIERIASREAKTLLREYADGDEAALLTREARAVLKRMR